VRAPVSVAATLVTARNAEASTGYTWPELAAFAEQKGIAIGRLGRRPYILLADLIEALDGVRAKPWSEEDTAREIEGSR
jgi:hypothetical protein